jgi:hypothetical protein
VLFQVSFDISKFGHQLVVFQNFKVLGVEISFVVSLELLTGLSWVDTFDDAESTEVLQTDLEVTDGITARFVLGGLSLDSFLNSFSHIV